MPLKGSARTCAIQSSRNNQATLNQWLNQERYEHEHIYNRNVPNGEELGQVSVIYTTNMAEECKPTEYLQKPPYSVIILLGCHGDATICPQQRDDGG